MDLTFTINMNNFINLYKYFEKTIYGTLVKHSFNTANIMDFFHKRLNLPFDKHKLYFSSVFHDIGLLTLSPISKYDKTMEFFQKEPDINKIVLNLDEKNTHSVVGSYFLKNIDFDEEYQRLLHYHHLPLYSAKRESKVLQKLITAFQVADHLSIESFKNGEKNKNKIIENVLNKFDNTNGLLHEVKNVVKEIPENVLYSIDLEHDFKHMKLDLNNAIKLAKGITLLIDVRSPYTRNHSTIVSRVSKELTKILMSKEDSQLMELIGLIHDIGKLNVPLSILHKNGPLNDNEWKKMKKHIKDTHDILFNNGFSRISKVAASHHERLDGSGYPTGIEEENLNLYSRIIQVADIYSALIEERPYRKKMNPEKALKIIKEEVKNNKFDQRVYDTLDGLVSSESLITKKTYYQTLNDFLGINLVFKY